MDESLRQLIIQELSLEGKSEKEVETVISALGGLILRTAFLTITETLDDTNVILFEKIIASNNQEELASFFTEHVENLDDIMAQSSREVLEEFKKK